MLNGNTFYQVKENKKLMRLKPISLPFHIRYLLYYLYFLQREQFIIRRKLIIFKALSKKPLLEKRICNQLVFFHLLKPQVFSKRFLRYEDIGFPLEHKKVIETFCSEAFKWYCTVPVMECVFVTHVESSLRLLIGCLFFYMWKNKVKQK